MGAPGCHILVALNISAIEHTTAKVGEEDMSNTQDNENLQLNLFNVLESTSSHREAESQHELKESFSIIDDEERRSNIERIIKSYRYPWDVYAELIQNSVDAIFDAKKQLHLDSPRWKGKIEITVEPEKRRLVIEDNGIGIPPEKIGQVIVFGKSFKRAEQQSRHGFMGYGLTFVAFQSSFINLESSYIDVDTHKNQGKKSRRTYRNLYTYVFKKEELPDAEAKPAPQDTKFHGTKIEIQFPNDREAFHDRQLDIDTMLNYANNSNLFEYIMRTKTAIGNTDKLFNNKPICDIDIIIHCNGNTLKIPFNFLGLTEVLKKVGINEDRCKSLSDFLKLLELTESEPKQEKDRRRRVQAIKYANETPTQVGERLPIECNYYIFATSKERINRFNREILNLNNSDIEALSNGIFLSLDGMPTSIRLDSWPESYFSQFTILVDAKSIKTDLDAGRKGISDYRKKQLVQKAEEILKNKNFIRYRRYIAEASNASLPNSSSSNSRDSMKRDVRDQKIRISFDLPQESQPYQHSQLPQEFQLPQQWLPPIEEQEVIALFMELIGNKSLQGYYLMKLSTYDRYDGLFEYRLPYSEYSAKKNCDNPLNILEETFFGFKDEEIYYDDLIVEFKYKLDSIYDDIRDKRKDMRDINLLVCWEMDFNKIKDQGDELTEIAQERRSLDGVTHELDSLDANRKIPVICLKTFLEKTKSLSFEQ